MAAGTSSPRTTRTSRTRLPLTPHVTSGRRGGHVVVRPERTETQDRVATGGVELVPAARGVRLAGAGESKRRSALRALDLHGLRI